MKTTPFLFLALCFLFFNAKIHAQATTANSTNTISTTAYLGSGASSNIDVQFRRKNVNAGRLATTFTSFGLNTPITLPSSVLIGVSAGQYSSGAGFNTYIGENAGRGLSTTYLNTGQYNTLIGYNSGVNNLTGSYNIMMGALCGSNTPTGSYNSYIGYGITNSGADNTFLGAFSGLTSGDGNVSIGISSGNLEEGFNNVFIGNRAGTELMEGNYNIFIGNNCNPGFGSAVSNEKLFIDIRNSDSPLIWGDFAADQLKLNGKVGIGGNSTTGFGTYPSTAGGVDVNLYQLYVKGGILTEEVRVSLSSTWADYVFNKDYNLKPLSEVEKFINDNGHLPNVPSAAQVKEEGIELGNMAKIQQEKIEELTLYIIEQNKINEKQSKEIEELKKLLIELVNKK